MSQQSDEIAALSAVNTAESSAISSAKASKKLSSQRGIRWATVGVIVSAQLIAISMVVLAVDDRNAADARLDLMRVELEIAQQERDECATQSQLYRYAYLSLETWSGEGSGNGEGYVASAEGVECVSSDLPILHAIPQD